MPSPASRGDERAQRGCLSGPMLPRTIIGIFFVVLWAAPAATGQRKEPWEQFNWGADLSAKYLYQPAWRIEFEGKEIRFLARDLTYVFHSVSNDWFVHSSPNEYEHFGGWVRQQGRSEYVWVMVTSEGRLEAIMKDAGRNRGTLELRWGSNSKPFANTVLWTREQLGRKWFKHVQKTRVPPPASPEELARKICVSPPGVADWDEDGQSIWLAIRFYAGEGCAGLGTIVEIKKSSHDISVHQPAELALVSISHLTVFQQELWLATERFGEGGTGSGIGLVRYNPQTRHAKIVPPQNLVGSHITALGRQGRALWVATDEGFTRFDLVSRRHLSWRIVPRVNLPEATSVSDVPAGDTRGRLASGQYEVRWIGEGYLEVLTPTCTDGWIKASWFKHLIQRHFFQSPVHVASASKWGNPPALSLFSSPVPETHRANPSAWFFRVPATLLEDRRDAWHRVRACAGWIGVPAARVHLTVEAVH